MVYPDQHIQSSSVSVQAIADPTLVTFLDFAGNWDPTLAFVNPADAKLFEFIVSPGISTLPIPSALAPFGSGIVLLGTFRRRKQIN